MSRSARLALFSVAGAALAALLVFGFARMPAFGHYRGIYGEVLDRAGVSLRHATNLVTGINFDFRGFDTLGEEFILFGSVLGMILILRDVREENGPPNKRAAKKHEFAGASEALRALALLLVATLIAIGIYIVVHGQITPGGGFQGGLILATAPLAVLVGGRYIRMRFVAPHLLVELGDSIGALGYALVGLGGLVFVGVFFKNFLPLGIPGHLLSAGQIDLASTAVGLEVSGAFLVAWSEFLDQAILVEEGEDA
jgi:multicomponent Na+:H+ antiporter subunit B